MIGRLVHTADFQRLLAAPSRWRSAHFALHHVALLPTAAARSPVHLSSTDLSTSPAPGVPDPVDKCCEGVWLGNVIPKRHARRAVTRNLVRRQIRAAMHRHLPGLPPGLWLVRLRQPFDRRQFVSAASERLRQALRAELDPLFARASAGA
jgi:ribonuclease P protein component